MAFIGLGQIGKNLIPILIGCIICFSTRLLFLYDGTNLFKHEIIPNIIVAASQLLTIIPHIMIKKQIIRGYDGNDLDQEYFNNNKLIYNEKTNVQF